MAEEKEYDFVIIGSGMGGLLTAAILAKEGFSVVVLEKNHQIGGSLQVFSRDKCIFDTGVHYLGSLDEGENLYQIFKYVDILDDLKLKRLDEDCFDEIAFADGRSIKLGQGYDQFKKGLYADFPGEEKAIDAYCDKILEICDYFPLYNLESDEEAERSYITHPEILAIGAWDFLDTITKNEVLKNVLVGNGLLYAGDRKTTPLYMVALIMNSYLKGSYRLMKGGSQIAKALTKKIHANGGKVIKHMDVAEAIYNDGDLSAVKTKTGEIFEGKNFISNVHPKLTVKIFGEDHFRTAYKHRLSMLKNTVSSFMVYISFKENSFPYINRNIYAYTQNDTWDTVDYEMQNWPQAMFICTPSSTHDEEYAESISIMTYMRYEEVQQWEDTFNTVAKKGNRGEEYEQFKREKEERVIQQLEKFLPEIRKSIKSVYSSTPLTYKDYIGTEDGSLYGILKDFNHSLHSKINTKTKIPNLYQTGQNLVFHGILGASIGALVTSFNFVDNKELTERIKLAK